MWLLQPDTLFTLAVRKLVVTSGPDLEVLAKILPEDLLKAGMHCPDQWRMLRTNEIPVLDLVNVRYTHHVEIYCTVAQSVTCNGVPIPREVGPFIIKEYQRCVVEGVLHVLHLGLYTWHDRFPRLGA